MQKSPRHQFLAGVILAVVCQNRSYASDTLLLHGHIYTGNAKMPWAEALAISGTRIDAVGTDRDVGSLRRGRTKELLDLAVPDRPLVVHNSSEHALWVNSATLRMAGITNRPAADAQEERGIIRDASGRPSGVLLEAGMEGVRRAVAERVPVEEQLAMLKAATHYRNTFGITSVVNATGNLGEIRLFAALRDRGELTARAHRLARWPRHTG